MLLLSNLLLNSVHSTWRHFSCSWPCFLPTFTTYHQIVFSKPKLPTTVSLFQALLHMDVSSHEVSTPSLAQKFSVVLHNLKQSKLLHIFPLHSFPQLYAALSSLGCTLLLNTPYTRLPPLGDHFITDTQPRVCLRTKSRRYLGRQEENCSFCHTHHWIICPTIILILRIRTCSYFHVCTTLQSM